MIDWTKLPKLLDHHKKMIIQGGENIYPAEIEAFYYEHPDISEIAVVGIPDVKMGEEVGAWIKFCHDPKWQTWARTHMSQYSP